MGDYDICSPMHGFTRSYTMKEINSDIILWQETQ